ncbi:MAG: hypothetical protein OHK0022_30260 [Roseiflexaceae bacterium]
MWRATLRHVPQQQQTRNISRVAQQPFAPHLDRVRLCPLGANGFLGAVLAASVIDEAGVTDKVYYTAFSDFLHALLRRAEQRMHTTRFHSAYKVGKRGMWGKPPRPLFLPPDCKAL